MKRFFTIFGLLALIGWSGVLNAQWLTNQTSWVTTSQDVTNPTNIFDNNESTTGYITCPNHTEKWGSVEINLSQPVTIDSIRYKWTRRDRKYDYSPGVACWFRTKLSYYDDATSQWILFMADTLDVSADNGSVATRTGWSEKSVTEITASKLKLEIGTWWWGVNTIDFSVHEFYIHSKESTPVGCNFINNSTSWLNTSDITSASNILDNNQNTNGYLAMSNYSTTYTKSAEINFPSAKSISSFKFKYAFPTTTGYNPSCTWSSGPIAHTCKVKLYYDNGSGWQEAFPVTTNLNTAAPVGICEYVDSAQFDFANTITAQNWKIEMIGNYWLGGGYQSTTYFRLYEVGFKECSSGCNFNADIFANGSTTFCDGENITLLSTQQGSPYIFQWLLNGNEITGEVNDSLIVTETGDYSLFVDSLGCTDTSNVLTINVNPLPTVSINTIPSFVNYNASPLSLIGNPTGGVFSGIGISGNSFNPNTAGLGSHTISYEYTNSNNCSNFTSVYTIVYDTTGIVCTSYDTVITNVYDTTFVTVTDTNYVTINDTAYISVTDTLIIDAVLTGITPPNNINTLKIYPNPASTHIYINNGDYTSMNGYTITIENSLSQVVFTSLINQAEFYIDLSTWSGNGLYIVKIIDISSNVIETKKIIIQ